LKSYSKGKKNMTAAKKKKPTKRKPIKECKKQVVAVSQIPQLRFANYPDGKKYLQILTNDNVWIDVPMEDVPTPPPATPIRVNLTRVEIEQVFALFTANAEHYHFELGGVKYNAVCSKEMLDFLFDT